MGQHWLRWLGVAAVLVSALPAMQVQGANPAEFAIPGGYFYTQAAGSSDQSKGFGITDNQGVPFRSEFVAQGGVDSLGYPSSRRFVMDGFVAQATQRAILQWMPGANQVARANVFDVLHDRGLDSWLLATRQIPAPFDTSPDTGLPFERVVSRHLTFLDISPAIRARYFSEASPVERFGLPMSAADLGSVVVVRAQRAAFQEWKINTPWARAGAVTLVNSGDIAKEVGLVPAGASAPDDLANALVISESVGPSAMGQGSSARAVSLVGAGAGSAVVHTKAAAPWVTGPRSGPISGSPIANFGEVSSGILYRSAQPEADGYKWLLSRGFKSIVSFRRETDDTTVSVLNKGFRNYQWLSIEDETNPSDAQAEAFLSFVTDSRNWPILVHCKVGLGRTGTMIALVRYAIDGWSMDEALSEARLYRGGVDLVPSQVEWLKHWEATHPPACHRPAKV